MTLYLKIHFFFCLCCWLIEETIAAEHYERTKFDLYKGYIFPVLTLTCVLMDNFLSLFSYNILFYLSIWPSIFTQVSIPRSHAPQQLSCRLSNRPWCLNVFSIRVQSAWYKLCWYFRYIYIIHIMYGKYYLCLSVFSME